MTALTVFVHGMKKKIFSYWFLHFIRHVSQSGAIFAPLCSLLFKSFRKENNFLFPSLALFFLCWIAGVAELWPLIFITLYQVDQRVLEWLTFTTLASSLTLRIVICSFPRQPTRTLVQRGLTDIEWRSIKTEPASTKYNTLVLIDGWYIRFFVCLFVFKFMMSTILHNTLVKYVSSPNAWNKLVLE